MFAKTASLVSNTFYCISTCIELYIIIKKKINKYKNTKFLNILQFKYDKLFKLYYNLIRVKRTWSSYIVFHNLLNSLFNTYQLIVLFHSCKWWVMFVHNYKGIVDEVQWSRCSSNDFSKYHISHLDSTNMFGYMYWPILKF